jgi:hypothetical protein
MRWLIDFVEKIYTNLPGGNQDLYLVFRDNLSRRVKQVFYVRLFDNYDPKVRELEVIPSKLEDMTKDPRLLYNKLRKDLIHTLKSVSTGSVEGKRVLPALQSRQTIEKIPDPFECMKWN